jgi:AsmA protein
MPTDPGTAAGAASAPAPKGSRAWRIFRTVLIGAVVSLALLIAFPPTGLIKDQLAKSIGQSIGRTVTIGGLKLAPVLELGKPKLTVTLTDIAVANPEGMPKRDVLRVGTSVTQVEVLPLIKGRVRLGPLDLAKPEFLLEEDATGARNWVFAPKPNPIQSPAPAAGAEPVAETVPAPTVPVSTPTAAPALTLPPVITITDGTFSYQSALTGGSSSASAINSVQTLDAVTGAATSKGSLAAGGETVRFDAAVGDFDAVTAGTTTTLKGNIDSRPLRADVDGTATFSAAAEFRGLLKATTTSLMDLAAWAGAGAAPSGEPIKTSLEGKVIATTHDVTFSETDVLVNTTNGRFDGVLDFAGVRPKLSGALASEHLDLGRGAAAQGRSLLAPAAAPETDFEPLIAPSWDRLLSDLNALERGPQAAAQAEAAAASATATKSTGWSEQPFNLKSLASFDLDMLINATTITYGALDLKQGRVKAVINDGVLDAKLEELSVGAGKAVGALNLDSKASPPKGALTLNMSQVAAEPIVTEITGKPLLSGTSDVDITAQAAGQNQSQLAATLDGKARFKMGQGALRGFDVRRMIFEWWKSWKFDLAMRTGFERLEAQYDIKRGIMKSEPGLEVGGPEVEINSAGTVNVPKKLLNQEIRVKAIPPPTAFPIPIKITGEWAKPSIGIDWGGLFSAAPGLGGPQALAASPEPPPANVEAAIRRVLALDLPPDQLTPEARAMLESLLPKEPAP